MKDGEYHVRIGRTEPKETRPLNGYERNVLEYMMCLNAKLNQIGDRLESRVREIPNGWRDYQLMRKTLDRLTNTLIQGGLNESNYKHFVMLLENGEVNISMRKATRKDEIVCIEERYLNFLLDSLIDTNCTVCLKDAQEVRSCRVRKMLDDLCPVNEPPRFGCGYRRFAQDDDYEKERLGNKQ